MAIPDTDPSDSHSYLEILHPVHFESKIKGSRFISHAFPVQSEEQCQHHLATTRKQFHDATHICYAYRVGRGDQSVFRYSDAGEPAGSAGAPIYRVIEGMGLTNILILVVRYFGGTKLGIGGLIRAYTEATQKVLHRAEIVRKEAIARLHFQIGYDSLNQVMHEISSSNAQIVSQSYADRIEFVLSVPEHEVKRVTENLQNLCAGKVIFLPLKDTGPG